MFVNDKLNSFLKKVPPFLRKSLAYFITSILTFKALGMALDPKEDYEWALIVFVTAFITSAEMMFFSHGRIDWIERNFIRAIFRTTVGIFFASISVGASIGYFYTTQESSQETHREYKKKVAELDSLKSIRNNLYTRGYLTATTDNIQPEINRLETEIKELKKQPDSQKSVGNAFAEKIAKITGMDEGAAGFYIVFYLAIILEVGCVYVYCFDGKKPAQKSVPKIEKKVQDSVPKNDQKSKTGTEHFDDKNPKNDYKKEDENLSKKILTFFDRKDLTVRNVITACLTNLSKDGTPKYTEIAKDLGELELRRQDVYRIYQTYLSQKEIVDRIVPILKHDKKISVQNLSLKLKVGKSKKLQKNYAMALGVIDAEKQLKNTDKKTKTK